MSIFRYFFPIKSWPIPAKENYPISRNSIWKPCNCVVLLYSTCSPWILLYFCYFLVYFSCKKALLWQKHLKRIAFQRDKKVHFKRRFHAWTLLDLDMIWSLVWTTWFIHNNPLCNVIRNKGMGKETPAPYQEMICCLFMGSSKIPLKKSSCLRCLHPLQNPLKNEKKAAINPK